MPWCWPSPQFAAQHAAEHTRDNKGQIVLGPDLPPSASPVAQDVRALLRDAYPYLAVDAEQDGAGAQPTPLVTKAREARRSARRPARAWAQSEPGSIDIYNDLVVGKYSWVSDDGQGGSAVAEMASLPIHWLKDWTLCLDVECGPRPETVLHRLYGTVTYFEPDTGRLGFSHRGPPAHGRSGPPGRRAHRRPAAAPPRTGSRRRTVRRPRAGGLTLRGRESAWRT
ncbi:hypothetical protein [Streptomyces flavidovirens]|uniref:hypothetical protein n=1 Tax=Streptomyces flavidovirens TaxID=67298 RepID=UPI0036736EA2